MKHRTDTASNGGQDLRSTQLLSCEYFLTSATPTCSQLSGIFATYVPYSEIEDYGHAVEETIVTNISKMHINEHTFAHVFNPYDRV